MGPPWGPHVLQCLEKGKHEKLFLSETTRQGALTFGMKHHLVDFFQVCSNDVPVPKWPHPGGHMFYIGLGKILSETTKHRALIYGMQHHLLSMEPKKAPPHGS